MTECFGQQMLCGEYTAFGGADGSMAKNQLDDEDAAAQSPKRCSFCRRDPGKMDTLVEGPGQNGAGGVFICRECAKMALNIIEMEQDRIEEIRRRKK